MDQPLPLAELGRRIVIFGPSNSGKSTLAEALSSKLNIPAVHLDQLHHLPNTNWVPRPKDEFHQLQRQAISEPAWIMDGNYSGLAAERLARATGAIVLDGHHWIRLARYFNRTLFQHHRSGALAGNRDSVKWSMIHWVAVGSRHNGERHRALVLDAKLPHVFCRSMREVKWLYRVWDLETHRSAA